MMNAIGIEWIYALAGLAVGVIGAGIRVLKLERRNASLLAELEAEKRAQGGMEGRFRLTAQEAVQNAHEAFLQLAQERLKDAQKDNAHDLDKRQKAISDLIDPVNKVLGQMGEKLQDLEKSRLTAYAELRTHLGAMTADQAKLRQETATLVQALRSPSTRGQWGEMQLRRCLEMAGLQKGVHFEEQVSANSGQRPDVIIKLTGGQTIVIDSKAPLEGYLDALKEGVSEGDRDIALERHARHVREHIRKLGSKTYWEQFNTPEFVVMFLPGESYFSAALEKDHTLIETGVNEKVIPATPTTLISLLKAVMYGWRQEQLADSAREISALGAELYKSISVFSGHIQKVGKNLGTAMNAYNDAIGSLERNVLPKARKFEELHAAPQGQSLESPEQIDHAVRRLTAPEAADEETPEKRRA